MAAPGFEALLKTQELDTRLAQLEHARTHHPLRQKIATARKHALAVGARVQDEREERHTLERDQKRLDDEVAMIDAKRAVIETRLYDGSVTATKDLLALQEESKHLAERKNSLEDSELEIMERVEALQAVLDAAQAEIDRDEELVDQCERELAEELAALQTDSEAVESERASIVAGVPSELVDSYEALRRSQEGIVVARLVAGACQACHLNLSAMRVDQIGKLDEDVLVHCDQCGAILVR